MSMKITKSSTGADRRDAPSDGGDATRNVNHSYYLHVMAMWLLSDVWAFTRLPHLSRYQLDNGPYGDELES